MAKVIEFNVYATLVCMVGVLLLGRFVIRHVKFLKDYDIPDPVVGGVIVAFVIMLAHHFYNFKLVLDSSLKEPLMLTFFITIGLSADFASLKKGGKMLVVFLIAVGIFVIVQDLVGVGVASMIGVNPLMGLLGGSISLTGGHGTSAAWSSTFSQAPYNFPQSLEVSIVCATFGLVSGGIIGGPVACYLIKRYKLEPNKQTTEQQEHEPMLVFEAPKQERLITANSFIESLALVSIALLVGTFIAKHATSVHLGSFTLPTLPTFVWCLFVGVLLRNISTYSNIHKVFDREISVIGNVSLSLFLAFALMSINLMELVNLALPIAIILTVQVAVMILYSVFVTFRMCGKSYDAAVLSAGHCGFGLGATPTAMVNMQTITNHYGPSHVAFIVVPLVGAFFVDIINALTIKGFLALPFHY
ncbi:sodium/glutamate symporter [Helicobacter sp. NHP22-001]|uniref:sodium/glutamate symporter n=1 Tax=Helicobacter sp. NHP22-001 TaxID=3040202 RepID=UPI00244D9710|nr:sodium/glutamate symporter [Helicobacter sp. NHP22-001]GMB96563.1 Sodium/glutamate symporter GltS [Helicobacter sp. NHP22-001]